MATTNNANTNTNTSEQESEPEPDAATVDPTTIDLPYTLDNVLEINTRLSAHETTLHTTAPCYRHTASTYTAMQQTFTTALSLHLLSPTDETALLTAGTALQRAAQRMRVHLSTAELRCRSARRLLNEAMLTPAGGREAAMVVFGKFALVQAELRGSEEVLRAAGGCLEVAAVGVGPVVERVGGLLAGLRA